MNDFVGRFFEVMADRRSEYIDIRYAFAPGNKPSRWVTIPHSRADGIAALHEFLSDNGFSATAEGMRPDRIAPGFFRRIYLVLRSLADKGPYNFPVTARFKNMVEKFSGGHTPVASAGITFTTAETKNIAEAARAAQVSVNSYLLCAINQVIQSELTTGEGPLVWFIPVDLRPWLPAYPRKGNILSNLFVSLCPADSAPEIHERISGMLRKDMHWHTWEKLRLAARLGLFERLMKRPRKTEFHLHSGKKLCFTFSNLGKWQARATSGKNRHAPPVLFFPPPNTSAPASIGAVTVNGRLSLTLQVHPAIAIKSSDIYKILRTIRATLIHK